MSLVRQVVQLWKLDQLAIWAEAQNISRPVEDAFRGHGHLGRAFSKQSPHIKPHTD